jgi:hypothetical protein
MRKEFNFSAEEDSSEGLGMTGPVEKFRKPIDHCTNR